MPARLANLHILITRPDDQVQPLATLVHQHGGVAVCVPTLEIVGVPANAQQRNTLSNSADYDAVIFISRNAVEYASAITPLHSLALHTVFAPGVGTASALQRAGVDTVITPSHGYHSEALLALDALTHVQGKHLLIVRGQGGYGQGVHSQSGRELLRDKLVERGAKVDYVAVYRRCQPADCAEKLRLAVARPLHAVTVGSGETLQNLLACWPAAAADTLRALPLFTPGLRVAALAQAHGFKHAIPSQSPDPAGFANSLLEWADTQGPFQQAHLSTDGSK